MNRTEYLLACMAEECAEIAQRATKAMRFGVEEVQPGQEFTNGQRIVHEYADLIAVFEMLDDAELSLRRDFDSREFSHRVAAKKEKVRKFMAYSVECGALQEVES